MRNTTSGRFGAALACFFALVAPLDAATACMAPIEKNPRSANVDTVLLATALDEVEYGSGRASYAHVDKVIEGKYTPKTFQLFGENFRSTCREGRDMGQGTKLVIYLHDHKDPQGNDQGSLLFWLTMDEAKRLDPRFRTAK